MVTGYNPWTERGGGGSGVDKVHICHTIITRTTIEMPLSKALNLQGASRWATSLITACSLPPCEGEGRKSLPVRLRLHFDHRTRRLLFKEAFIFVVFNQFGLNFPSEEIKKQWCNGYLPLFQSRGQSAPRHRVHIQTRRFYPLAVSPSDYPLL